MRLCASKQKADEEQNMSTMSTMSTKQRPEIPIEILQFHATFEDLHDPFFIVEMLLKKEVFTKFEVDLELWPDGWQLGGHYTLSEFLAILGTD